MQIKQLLFIILFSLPILQIFSLDQQPGIVADTDLRRLEKRIAEVEFTVERYQYGGETRLTAVSDFHGVIDIDLKALAVVISDHDNGESVFNRMVETIDLNPDLPLTQPHRQWVHNSAKFLGIGQDYKYTTLLTVDYPTDNEFVMNWKMVDIEEGNFVEYEGFWYLQTLESSESKPRTYIRLYAETIFDNIIPMQQSIMKMFTASETRDVFRSVYRAAKNKR